MKNRILASLIVLAILSLSVLLIFGCGSNPSGGGGGGTPTHGTYSYLGTQSPGDVWAWTIGRDTFICTDEADSLMIWGTWSTLPSGFKQAVVTDSDPTGSVEAGSVAYFLEYPNILLIVKPTGEANNNNVIVCAGRPRSAPYMPVGYTAHFSGVAIPSQEWDAATVPSYGKVDVTNTGATFTFAVEGFNLNDFSVTNQPGSGFRFSDGRFTKEGESIQIFITSSGVFVCDTGTLGGGYAGMQTPTSFHSTEVASHTYHGFLFTYDTSEASGDTLPIKAQSNPSMAGSINGYEFTDVETGTLETGPSLTLEFSSAVTANKIIKGSIFINGYESDIRVVTNKVGSKHILFGISEDQSGNPQNLLLIQN